MRHKKILCVEDNEANMLLISRIVEAENHVLLQAKDGAEAFRILQAERPDLILLDINIPGINGLELARRVKHEPEWAAIPIIATTANVLVGDREKCLEAGCDEYLPKPLDIYVLRAMIRQFLEGEFTNNHNPAC